MFYKSQSDIHVIVRGLIVQNDAVVVCGLKGSDHYFLPGGHVENGESVKYALLRELREEMGIQAVKVGSFIGVCENIFPVEGADTFQQEINIVFEVKVSSELKISSQEDHIEFAAIPILDIKEANILPVNLRGEIVGWFKNRTPFFKSFAK